MKYIHSYIYVRVFFRPSDLGFYNYPVKRESTLIKMYGHNELKNVNTGKFIKVEK